MPIMRTTVTLDEDVVRELKARGEAKRQKFQAGIERGASIGLQYLPWFGYSKKTLSRAAASLAFPPRASMPQN